MNILIGAIIGAIAALFFPYLLKKLKVNENTIKKVTPIIVVIAAILSVKLYGYYQAENLTKDKANLSSKLDAFEKLFNGDASGVENKTANADDVDANDVTRASYVLEEITKTSKPYIERINSLNQKINKLASDELLNEKIYSDRNALNAAKDFAIQYPLLIEEDLAIFDALIVAQRKTINSLKVSKKFVDDMKGGFEKSFINARKLRVERLNASKRFADKVMIIVQLADKNFGKVKISNAQVDFSNEEDNTLYNKNFAELQQAADDEEKALKALSEHQASSIGKMKAIAN
jgi:hypothetical protein